MRDKLIISILTFLLFASCGNNNSPMQIAKSINDSLKPDKTKDSVIYAQQFQDTNSESNPSQGQWFTNYNYIEGPVKEMFKNGLHYRVNNHRSNHWFCIELVNSELFWAFNPKLYINLHADSIKYHHQKFNGRFNLGIQLSHDKDSGYVIIPYDNGNTWIEGKFIYCQNYVGAAPSGTLKTYYENGKIHFIENWFTKINDTTDVCCNCSIFLNGKFYEYLEDGKLLKDTTFNMYRVDK